MIYTVQGRYIPDLHDLYDLYDLAQCCRVGAVKLHDPARIS